MRRLMAEIYRLEFFFIDLSFVVAMSEECIGDVQWCFS